MLLLAMMVMLMAMMVVVMAMIVLVEVIMMEIISFQNFFSRKSQQLKSNLKRTKSATKLDRKKTNGDSDG